MKTLCLFVFALSMFGLSACGKAEPPKPIFDKWLPNQISLPNQEDWTHDIRYQKTGGTMRYIMKPVTQSGKQLLQLQVFFNPQPDSVPDTIYLDANTLAFVERRLELPDYLIQVYFAEGRFHGDLHPAPESDYQPVVYDKMYPHGAFEPAVINYAIKALPLAEGFTASIPVFDLNNGSQMFWSNIAVVGREELTINDKKYDTWKVESKGIRNKTIWISVDKPYAIKMETEGNFGAWELLE